MALCTGLRNATSTALCRTGFQPFRQTTRAQAFARRSARTQLDIRCMATLVDYRGKPQYDIYVKGSPERPELGDCPFSHRTMLTFEEKGIRYNKVLLDENNMPDWIKDVCEGKKQIPFVCELDTGKWMYDSDAIIPYLEDKYPEPRLGKPDDLPQIDKSLFPYFLEFVKSEGKDNQEQASLLKELKKIDEFLGKSDGNFFGGSSVDALDMQLAPKLKHIMVGSKHVKAGFTGGNIGLPLIQFQDWEIPKDLANIYDYMQHISERESWKQTYYTEEYVADGWKLKQKKLRGQV